MLGAMASRLAIKPVAAAQNFGSGGILADSLAVGDFNDDGNVDLVVSNEQASSTCCNVGNIGILFGNGMEPSVPPRSLYPEDPTRWG